MKVLELFSGIGGMHMALSQSEQKGTIKAAVEINNVANSIYNHNFPEVNLLNLNIEGLSADKIKKLDVDTILMSPPCQPFTRNGKQNDIHDARTDAFQHVLSLLPSLNIQNLLIENVKGFETSEMRDVLIKCLKENDFIFQEFILSPSQFGTPNSRHRYYCLATKPPNSFTFKPQESPIMEVLPETVTSECFKIEDILEDVDFKKYALSDRTLIKRLKVLDICYGNSKRSCCFTKAYGRFIEGTGSVYTDNSEGDLKEKLQKLREMNNDTEEYLELAQSLNLRFFTPKEISRLMCFPDTFSFPSDIGDRKKYMVLGNSINVKVVSELIKLFCLVK